MIPRIRHIVRLRMPMRQVQCLSHLMLLLVMERTVLKKQMISISILREAIPTLDGASLVSLTTRTQVTPVWVI